MKNYQNNLRYTYFNDKVQFSVADISKALNLTAYQVNTHAAAHLTTLSPGQEGLKRRTRFIDHIGAISLTNISTSPHAKEFKQTLQDIISEALPKEFNKSNNVSIFTSSEFGNIRTVIINNEPWFVGKDIAEALGYAKARNAIATHVASEDKKEAPIQGTLGGVQKTTIINESGLYSLILSSKLDSAKRFKHWVTSEVLPAIRKHGMYATEELIANPDLAIAAFTALKEEREKRKALEEAVTVQKQQIAEMKPKADFSDQVSVSSGLISIKEMADLLSDRGYRYTQNSLFQFLRENKILSSSPTNWNQPYRKYMDAGYFKVKESIYYKNGYQIPALKTVVTGTGQHFIYELILQKGF